MNKMLINVEAVKELMKTIWFHKTFRELAELTGIKVDRLLQLSDEIDAEKDTL